MNAYLFRGVYGFEWGIIRILNVRVIFLFPISRSCAVNFDSFLSKVIIGRIKLQLGLPLTINPVSWMRRFVCLLSEDHTFKRCYTIPVTYIKISL